MSKKDKNRSDNVPDYYKIIPKKYLSDYKTNYPNFKNINIKLPMHMIIAGKTGSYKTNALMHLIKSMECFDKFIICVKKPSEPFYAWLIDTVQKLEEESGEEGMVFVTTNPTELPPIEEVGEGTTLFIADDMMTESKKDQKMIEEYYIRGRKDGISCVYISQSYFSTPINIRKNSDICILKDIVSVKELANILREYSFCEDPKKIAEVYNKLIKPGGTDFFMIDKATNNPIMRYRRNFKGIDPKYYS